MRMARQGERGSGRERRPSRLSRRGLFACAHCLSGFASYNDDIRQTGSTFVRPAAHRNPSWSVVRAHVGSRHYRVGKSFLDHSRQSTRHWLTAGNRDLFSRSVFSGNRPLPFGLVSGSKLGRASSPARVGPGTHDRGSRDSGRVSVEVVCVVRISSRSLLSGSRPLPPVIDDRVTATASL